MFSLGLIGYPVAHSFSPLLHRAALDELGLSGEYRLYPVPPLPEGRGMLSNVISRVRSGEINGLNVTIPHKQSVISYLDEISQEAEKIGAVNTIVVSAGHLIGENTDSAGFLSDLRNVSHSHSWEWFFHPSKGTLNQPDSKPYTTLILGAGGSARAVVFALLSIGCNIILAARSLTKAQILAKTFQASFPGQIIKTIELDQVVMEKYIHKVQLVVNTTPLGMVPSVEASPWPNDLKFPSNGLVYDLVYNPPITRLMREAGQAGCIAVNGLGMLVEQAALSFERWTGMSVSRTGMFRAVSQRIAENR